jgi:hypothetical protein
MWPDCGDDGRERPAIPAQLGQLPGGHQAFDKRQARKRNTPLQERRTGFRRNRTNHQSLLLFQLVIRCVM